MMPWNGCSRSRGTGAQHPWNAHVASESSAIGGYNAFAASLRQRGLFRSDQRATYCGTADEHPKEWAQFLFSLTRWAHACSGATAGDEGQSRLTIGAIYALATAALLATQSPLSFLAAKRLSGPQFIAVTELVLLLCVPFMIRTQQAARAEQVRPWAPRFFGHCRSRRRHRNFCVAKE